MMTKDELVMSIKHEHGRLDKLVASLDEARLTAPSLDDGWSVKDLLAHITAWEQLCAWTLAAERGERQAEPDLPIDPREVEQFNAATYDANRERPLADVLADARRSYEEVLATVGRLSDDDLRVPGTLPWTRGNSLERYVRDNADEHYREHVEQIETWIHG